MDFQAARRMWEAAASSPSSPASPSPSPRLSIPTPPPPTPSPRLSPRPVSAPAPAMPSPSPSPSPSPEIPSLSPAALSPAPTPAPDDARSDYSELDDYAADAEFYVPGVNHPAPSTPTSSSSSPPEPPSLSRSASSSSSAVVRQHSNFSRLSAQSWLTVDSAQDLASAPLPPAPSPAAPAPQPPLSVPRPRDIPILPSRRFPLAHQDRDPATLFGVDPHARRLPAVLAKPLREMSVFECCAALQAGLPAYKKKTFRRFGARRVWLSPECDRLLWTSKKDGVSADHIKLQKVAKMKCLDREVSVDVTEGYRISLLFANPDEAGLWVRALSCLIPLQARVRAPRGIIPPDKDREDYTLIDDVFDGRPLRDCIAVNSYVVLCAAKEQPPQMGSKLAFSRSDASFCGLRYIPFKLVPLLLRSQEEIAVLKRLAHPNVVKYHECLQDQDHGGNYVIFEHLARGSLIDSSKLEGVPTVPESTARERIRDVVNGLEYLHSLRIAHGDIRPDNLLRSVNGSIKINPLGCITHDFTEIQNVPALVRARLGDASPAFLAPELCWLSDAPSAHAKSYAMDVWAVGVVLYFMLYGRVPFGGRDDTAIQESICKGKLRFPRHPETSRKVRSLLKGVLGEKDPKTRIALSELQRHPWFTESETGSPLPIGETPREPARLIVSPEEVDSAVQIAKVGVTSKKR